MLIRAHIMGQDMLLVVLTHYMCKSVSRQLVGDVNEVNSRPLVGVLNPVFARLGVGPVPLGLRVTVLGDQRVALGGKIGDDGVVVDHPVSAVVPVVGDEVAKLGTPSAVLSLHDSSVIVAMPVSLTR